MVNPEPTKRDAIIRTPGDGLAIILIETSLAENIGMTARAMMNFGLTDLRLVRPKCKWPHTKAINASSGAHGVLTNAKIENCNFHLTKTQKVRWPVGFKLD